MFSGKKLLITGGTGSFGSTMLKNIIKKKIGEIIIFSRDEKKQEDLRKKFNNSKIKFIIGDVRDYSSVKNATKNIDFIFHAAALKQVPSCEFFPDQAIKTNTIGTLNVIEASIENNVKKLVCLSTDKAVYPINAMGMSKALMEKIALANCRNSKRTTICITRYGNVMNSRGSVIPLFVNQIKENQPLTITNKNMTRFMMSLEESIELVLYAFKNGKSGDIFIKKSPSTTIDILYKSLLKFYNKPSAYPVKILGFRHGEKLHETLISAEESLRTEDIGKFYRIRNDIRSLNYANFEKKPKMKSFLKYQEYNSNNTHKLNINKVLDLLKKINLNETK